jgi:hypothetical protein
MVPSGVSGESEQGPLSAAGQNALQDMVELDMYLVGQSQQAPWLLLTRCAKAPVGTRRPHSNPTESSAVKELLGRSFVEATSSRTLVVSKCGCQFYHRSIKPTISVSDQGGAELGGMPEPMLSTPNWESPAEERVPKPKESVGPPSPQAPAVENPGRARESIAPVPPPEVRPDNRLARHRQPFDLRGRTPSAEQSRKRDRGLTPYTLAQNGLLEDWLRKHPGPVESRSRTLLAGRDIADTQEPMLLAPTPEMHRDSSLTKRKRPANLPGR